MKRLTNSVSMLALAGVLWWAAGGAVDGNASTVGLAAQLALNGSDDEGEIIFATYHGSDDEDDEDDDEDEEDEDEDEGGGSGYY